jgi:tetratricopeptide (TPR) repeat protein
MMFLGILLIIGAFIDIYIESYTAMHLFFILLGIVFIIYSLGMLNFKSLFKGKLAIFSNILSKLIIVGLFVALYIFTTNIFIKPDKKIEIQIAKAHQYEDSKEYVNAYNILKGLLDKKVDETRVNNELAKLYLIQNRNDEAAKILRDILKLEPSDNEARLSLISYYKSLKDYNNAIIEAQKIFTFDPHYYKGYEVLGDLYWETEDMTRGIVYYKLAIRENSSNVLLHIKLGDAYEKTHSYGDALTEFNTAKEISKDEAQVRDIEGKLKMLRKSIDETAQKSTATDGNANKDQTNKGGNN